VLSMYTTCPAHVTFLDLIIPKIFVKSPNYEVLHYVAFIIFSLLPTYSRILFSTHFTNALICIFFNVNSSFTHIKNS
jgi:hypothetical protein